MRKSFLFFFTVVGFVQFSGVQSAEARRHHRKYKGPIIVNQILRLEGTMTVNGNPTMEFAGIKEGDLLETGAKSSAIIRIPGLGIYRLGENTKLKLSKFGGRDITKFELIKGDLLCIYKRLGTHEIRSGVALISPNGNTASNTFWLEDDDKEAYVTLLDGKISIKADNPQKEPVTVAAPAPTTKATPEAEIAKSNVPVDSKQDPAVPPPSEPVRDFVGEVTATTKDESKNYMISSDKGIVEKSDPAQNPPDKKIIQDLESLYALP